MENILHYNVVFKPEPEGGFTVIVPSLPGCVTYGKNLTHAKEMAQDAIKIYITSLAKHNEEIPSDHDDFTGIVDVNYSKDWHKRTPVHA